VWATDFDGTYIYAFMIFSVFSAGGMCLPG